MKRIAAGYSPRSLGAATRRSLLAITLLAAPASAQLDPPAWTRPVDPFRIVGNVWYVGTEGLAAYLIKTPAGAILIDGTMVENVPAVRRNIVRAGVKLTDVKWILVTHAHFDHAAGDAALKAVTGAMLGAGANDAVALEGGVPPGETNYGVIKFPPVKVDRRLRDGDTIKLGKMKLRAVATPGHTPGCTGYAVRTAGLHVLFPCSLTVAGNKLIGNRRYPSIVADFRASFARLDRERADVVLPSHPEQGDIIGRHKRGESYIARDLLADLVTKARASFAVDLAKQEAAAQK